MENIKTIIKVVQDDRGCNAQLSEFCGHSADSRVGLLAEPSRCEMFAAEAGSSAIVFFLMSGLVVGGV